MRWRWLILDYVDPQLGLTRSERSSIRRAAMKLSRIPRRDLPPAARPSLIASALTAGIPGSAMLVTIAPMLSGQVSHWFLVGFLPVQVAVTWLACAFAGRWSWRPLVIHALRLRGHDVCLGCSYSLRGLTDDTRACPECGCVRTPLDSERTSGDDVHRQGTRAATR